MSIKGRLWMAFGLLVVVAGTGAGVSWWLTRQASSQTRHMIEVDVVELEAANLADMKLNVARYNENRFFLTHDLQYVDKADVAVKSAWKYLEQIISVSHEPELTAAAREAQENLQQYESGFREVVELYTRRGLTREQGLEGELRSAVHAIEKVVNDHDNDELKVLMLMCRRYEKEYLLHGDSTHLTEIKKYINEFKERMQQADFTEAEQGEMRKHWEVYYKDISAIVQIDQVIESRHLAFDEAANSLEEIVLAIAETAHNNVTATEKLVLSELNLTQHILTAVFVGASVMGILIATLTSRSILKPLNAILSRLIDISEGEGDLTQRVEMDRSDEFGKLAHAFNRFVADVHDVVLETKLAISKVAQAAREIAATNEQVSANCEEQTRQVTEIAAATEEMSASAGEVSSQATRAASSATGAQETAHKGGISVQKTVEGITSISESVSSSADSVSELGKRGEEIGQVIEVINDIAEQTNLLALNAAIEAARAGEHGRGFAVVADEVRKLADRTTIATDEVSQSIQQIQSGTSEAIERMGRGTTEVESGVSLVNEAGDSLREIVGSAKEVKSQVEAIAAAAEEQSEAASAISRNITGIAQMTRETNDGIRTASDAVSQMSVRATALQELVSRFKVSERTHESKNGETTPTQTEQSEAEAMLV